MHTTPSNQRSRQPHPFPYKSPSEHRQHSPSYTPTPYFTSHSQLSPRQLIPSSPKVKVSIGERQQDNPITLKLITMKELVMELLVHGPKENKSVDCGLGEVLSHLKNMMGCVPRRNQRGGIGGSRQDDGWNEENRRLGATIGRLKDAAKTKEVKEALITLQRMREKFLLLQQKDKERQKQRQIQREKEKEGRLSPGNRKDRTDRNHISRRSQIFEQKKFQSKDHYVIESELKELKIEMVVLRKQKVKLMMELNREIDVSNKKSEEIKVLNGLLGRRGGKGEEGNKMVDRCRSNPKESNIFSSAQEFPNISTLLRQQQQLLHLKEKQIISLLSQNNTLRLQLKQSKQLPFTQSFLSDAFNVKQQIITSNKQQYQRTISTLKSHIFQLQNKVDSITKYSSIEGEDKRTACQQTAAEGKSFKGEGSKLLGKVTDLELCLRKEEIMRGSLEKEVEFLRAQEVSMGLEITYLKGEVGRLKSHQGSVYPSQQEIGGGKSLERQMASTGFRFRRS